MDARHIDRSIQTQPAPETRTTGPEIERIALLRAGRWAARIGSTLATAGIELDGSAPHDIRVRDARFFAAVATRGSFGLGEGYMEGWWECERIDQLVFRSPVRIGQIALVRAQVNAVFATSMEVGVVVLTEEPLTGEQRVCCEAYLTFVALATRA